MAWFERRGDARLEHCATENCGGAPIYRLEADGVGSNYCSGCRAKIENAAATTRAEIRPIHAAIPDGEVADLEKIALGFDSNAREARNEKNKCKPFQKGLRDQWAWGERSWTRQAVTIRQAIARLTALEAENAALKAEVAGLRKHAKAMTEALRKVRPLGGSELFVRVGEVFYADPIYCGNEIDRLRGELDKLRRAAIRSLSTSQGETK